MKRFFTFLRKYYGCLIGGAVGLLLMAVYYYIMWREPAASVYVLRVVEPVVPSIETITNAIGSVMGLVWAAFWLFLPIAALVIIVFVHVFTTVFIYGFIGFLIHYGIVRLRPRPVIDKAANI